METDKTDHMTDDGDDGPLLMGPMQLSNFWMILKLGCKSVVALLELVRLIRG